MPQYLRCQFSPKWSLELNQNPEGLSTEIKKLILKWIWRGIGNGITKVTLKRDKDRFQVHYKATIIRCHIEKGYIYRWMKRSKSPETDSHVYEQLIFKTCIKEILWKRESFQKMVPKHVEIHFQQ